MTYWVDFEVSSQPGQTLGSRNVHAKLSVNLDSDIGDLDELGGSAENFFLLVILVEGDSYLRRRCSSVS